MTRRDWLLLALRDAQAEGLFPIQLQKALFLLGQELPGAVGQEFYHFEPYNYGPFDKRVFEDAKALAGENLVRIVQPTDTTARRYTISPQGLARTEAIRDQVPARARQYLEDLIHWVQAIPVMDLVRVVLRKYPAYRANGVLQEQHE